MTASISFREKVERRRIYCCYRRQSSLMRRDFQEEHSLYYGWMKVGVTLAVVLFVRGWEVAVEMYQYLRIRSSWTLKNKNRIRESRIRNLDA